MGGKEGSRGYVYQGIVSVLNSFKDQDWDRIQIEFPTDGDKVDIALFQGEQVVKAIQVKSTINSFSSEEVKMWTRQIASDYPCAEYEIVLIGQCEKQTIDFTKAVEKYYTNSLDKQAKGALAGFPTTILDAAKVIIRRLPFDLNTLTAAVRDALFQFVSTGGARFEFEQIRLLASAAIGEQLLSSTNGSSIDRDAFEKDLQKRIRLLSSDPRYSRIPICICSVNRGVDAYISLSNYTLDLRGFFTDKILLSDYEWNRDLYPRLEGFFSNVDISKKYAVLLEAHTSLAFIAGRACDSKSGIDIVPFQKTFSNGLQLWSPDHKTAESYPSWKVEQKNLTVSTQQELALIINATHEILDDVVSFIEHAKLPVGKVISCTVNERGAGYQSIIDGYHALQLATEISNIFDRRTTEEKRCVVHLFASAPSAFVFYLGKASRMYGKFKLYEYDAKLADGNQYIESFSF